METLVLIVIVVVVVVAIGVSAQAKELRQAQERYDSALRQLDTSPGSIEARKSALEAGRAFAALARKQAGAKGVAIFDEVALSNDLAARTGQSGLPSHAGNDTKSCPDCAEDVRLAARKCRFCGHDFGS